MAAGGQDRLFRADMARLAGVDYYSLSLRQLPTPDGTLNEGGHARPWWSAETGAAWVVSRPGLGWKKGLKADEDGTFPDRPVPGPPLRRRRTRKKEVN